MIESFRLEEHRQIGVGILFWGLFLILPHATRWCVSLWYLLARCPINQYWLQKIRLHRMPVLIMLQVVLLVRYSSQTELSGINWWMSIDIWRYSLWGLLASPRCYKHISPSMAIALHWQQMPRQNLTVKAARFFEILIWRPTSKKILTNQLRPTIGADPQTNKHISQGYK